MKKGILICDFGSQYTKLIARKLRECGVYTEITSGFAVGEDLGFDLQAYILSGGPKSVNTDDKEVSKRILESGKPILGICFGMQLLSAYFGGKVESSDRREFGNETLKLKVTDNKWGRLFFKGTPESQQVWMSHQDHVADPGDLEILAYTEKGTVAALAHPNKPILALQYHPEVSHSLFGQQVLQNFAKEVCGLNLDWNVKSMLDELERSVKNSVTPNDQVLLAVSGGVDSTVSAVLLTKLLGPKKVHCVFVDTGLLRKGEASEVSQSLKALGLNLRSLDRSSLFLESLKGIRDPEVKRKRIGKLFIDVFESHAKTIPTLTHLGQGTLYPDVIESAANKNTSAELIKSHHNVGGLPDRLALKLIEPFRNFFKDEVRAVGAELGVPKDLMARHPFPGPGLGIRVIGDITSEKVKALQEADAIYMSALRAEGLYDKIWQAGVFLLSDKAVGVMGDQRTYENACVLRAILSSDGMTADVCELDLTFLKQVGNQIIAKVKGINRVLYDLTTKPPGTIEWE